MNKTLGDSFYEKEYNYVNIQLMELINEWKGLNIGHISKNEIIKSMQSCLNSAKKNKDAFLFSQYIYRELKSIDEEIAQLYVKLGEMWFDNENDN